MQKLYAIPSRGQQCYVLFDKKQLHSRTQYSPGTVAMCVSQNITIGVDGEIINNNNTVRKENNAVIDTLSADHQTYIIFNSKMG